MGIDILSERPLSFNDVAQFLPHGSRPSYSTWWRWWRYGIRGVRLETVVLGGRRYTSAEAVQRFVSAMTAHANGEPTPMRTPRRRQREQARARVVLHQAGIATKKAISSPQGMPL